MAVAVRFVGLGILAAGFALLSSCAPSYSPNTYASSAVQQANKVDRGVVIGFREVKISDDGTVGAVTGAAAGGILATQADSAVVPTALSALGGSLVGGIVGATVQHTTGDTTGWEYIVRETNGDLVSVTQRQPKPIAIGQKVLVIEGKQARIVPDYASAALEAPPAAAPEKTKTDAKAKPAAAPSSSPAAMRPAATPVETSVSFTSAPLSAPASASRPDVPIVSAPGPAPASPNWAATPATVAGSASEPRESAAAPSSSPVEAAPDASSAGKNSDTDAAATPHP